MLDETTERLGRAVSAYARCAHSIARTAASLLNSLPPNEYALHLARPVRGQCADRLWCLVQLYKAAAVALRSVPDAVEGALLQLGAGCVPTRLQPWYGHAGKTTLLLAQESCELTLWCLPTDAHPPEIAVHFLEAVSRLRLDPLPAYSHRHDSFFTQLAQELQLAHQEHLNRALDEKTSLIRACEQKLGVSWSTSSGWSKADCEKLLRLPEASVVEDSGRDDVALDNDHGNDSEEANWTVQVQQVFDEHEGTVRELLAVVCASVDASNAKAENGESLCPTDASQDGTRDTDSERRQRQQRIFDRLPPATRIVALGIAKHSTATGPQQCATASPSRERGDHRTNQPDAQETFTQHVADSSSSPALLDTVEVKKRPSSTQLPTSDAISRLGTQRDTGWVKMVVGGKTLHFETASTPSYGGNASASVASHAFTTASRRNAVPMALVDENLCEARVTSSSSALSGTRDRVLMKARPSSSPAQLSTKKSSVSTTTEGPVTAQHNVHMWAPTRGQCALCERRYMRRELASVVLMKRIFDQRRKWGMVIQDSKKFSAASSLYAKAPVCLLCREILLHEDEATLAAFESEPTEPLLSAPPLRTADVKPSRPNEQDGGDDVGTMIWNSILLDWHQQPHEDDTHLLKDIALNKRARQSSTVLDMDARNAVQVDAVRCAHTKEELQPWWEVDLANYYVVHSVKLWLRDDVSHLYNGNATRAGSVLMHGSNSASQITVLQQQQRKTTLRPTLQPRVRHLGAFPLHVSISMKTGVGRDMDDILASCVSSHCVDERVLAPIVWHAPPNSRGRFVRIQAEGQAILHIEKVHVYIASTSQRQQRLRESKMHKETLRHQLKRAAFRASIAVNPSMVTSEAFAATASDTARYTQETTARQLRSPKPLGSRTQTSEPTQIVHPHTLTSTFLDPAQAEKKRISRLYSRFKTLLDARSKYMVEELSQEIRHAGPS